MKYSDLIVWQKAMDLVEEVYKLSKKIPKQEQFGLTSQMQRSAVSIPSNIAEGHGRKTTNSYINHLSIAFGSLMELETQIIIAQRLNYVKGSDLIQCLRLSDEIGKMLSKLISSLKIRINKPINPQSQSQPSPHQSSILNPNPNPHPHTPQSSIPIPTPTPSLLNPHSSILNKMNEEFCKGFTFLELAFVICIVSILYAVVLHYFTRILAMIEQVTVEHTIIALRNGVEFQTYRHLFLDNMDALAQLENGNPMTYIVRVPETYIGELEKANPRQIKEGAWYFDKSNRCLVYRLQYAKYFESTLKDPPLIRLYIKLHYIDSNQNGRFDKGSERPTVVTLEAKEHYKFTVVPPLGPVKK